MSKSEDPLDDSLTVVKTATCDTLTKKSKLTYQIGTLPDGEVYVRIHKNSGNGFFSNEWISLADIQNTIAEIPAGKPVTAIVLGDLFQGRSVNTPGFLLAVLVQEKLLVPMQGKKRSHEPVSPAEFREQVQRLVSAKGKPKAAPRKTSPKKSTATKKKTQIKRQSQAAPKKKAKAVRAT
jgi:hypothetical protein